MWTGFTDASFYDWAPDYWETWLWLPISQYEKLGRPRSGDNLWLRVTDVKPFKTGSAGYSNAYDCGMNIYVEQIAENGSDQVYYFAHN